MSHAAEGSFLIISTSLATLRPLFRGIKRHVTDRTLHSKNTHYARHTTSIAKRQVTTTGQSLDEHIDDKNQTLEHVALVDRSNQFADRNCELEGGLYVLRGQEIVSTPKGKGYE